MPSILIPSFKKIVGAVFEKINKVSVLGQIWAYKGPKKGHPMHQSTWDLHHSIGIDVPFHCAKLKKIVGANLEKIDKVDFRDIHTHRHTYNSDLIGPFPFGGPIR